MTVDLKESVASALRNPCDALWLPGITPALVEYGWRDLYRQTGIASSQYGTARVLARTNSIPRRVIPLLSSGSSVDESTQLPQLEILGEELTGRYEKSGVRLLSEDEISRAKISERLGEAIDSLRSVPTLFETVTALAISIHLIDSGDDSYDVSFSDPLVPFSMFVSVPGESAQACVLRVAESIVHEAMHLLLTLVEKVVPLVDASENKFYSPWRGEYRDARGILHALFVFRVVDSFLMKLQDGRARNVDDAGYLCDRRRQIAEQVSEIRSFRECPELKSIGAEFVGHLLR